MPRRKEGGKIKSIKRITKDINKGLKKAENFGNTIGTELGQLTHNQLLPALVSAGIPLTSTALGVLGEEFGIPPELTSSLSSNLMKNYIPKHYQSNKYASALGDIASSGMTGDYEGAMNKTMDAVGSMMPKKRTGYKYNPDNPYEDTLSQQLSRFQPQPEYQPEEYQSQPDATWRPKHRVPPLADEGVQTIQDNMAHGKYEQRQGNPDALIGAGLKKRRGRKPKVITEEIEIYTKKKPIYKKFSHAKNSALDQLLEAKAEREEKEASKAMKKMVEQQSKMLTSLGYGIRKN